MSEIILIILGILQIILFFKLWGMCNDVRAIKESLVRSKSHEITNVDSWLKGEAAQYDENSQEDSQEDSIIVGAEVSSMVDKNGVAMGDIMIVKKKISANKFVCAVEGKTVGTFNKDELFLVK